MVNVFTVSTWAAVAAIMLAVSAEVQAQTVNVTVYHGEAGITNDLASNPKLAGNLQKLFGFSEYKKLGSASGTLNTSGSVTIKPTDKFSLEFSSRGGGIYQMVFMQGGSPIIDSDYVPKPKVPLFIKGPDYGKGVIVLAIESK